MITLSVSGQKKLIKKLNDLGKAKAGKILRTELRPMAKQVAEFIKPEIPVGKGKLRRRLTIRAVKKKKRYTVGFRIFFRALKQGKEYFFAPQYGVRDGRGKQPAHHFMEKGIAKGRELMPATLKRIGAAIKREWDKK